MHLASLVGVMYQVGCKMKKDVGEPLSIVKQKRFPRIVV